MRHSDLIAGAFRLGLGCVFAYAAYAKLRDPTAADAFLAAILRIDIPGAGFLIGLAEALLAGALLLGLAPRTAARGAVLASGAFLTVHAFAKTLPEPPPPCGCLGAPAAASTGPAATDPAVWLWVTGAMVLASSLLLWLAPPARHARAVQTPPDAPPAVQEPNST